MGSHGGVGLGEAVGEGPDGGEGLGEAVGEGCDAVVVLGTGALVGLLTGAGLIRPVGLPP